MMDINKFNFVQMFNDSKGKTSSSKFLAIIGGLVSLGTFSSCAFVMLVLIAHEAKTDITSIVNLVMMQSVALFTICMGVLTTRRFTKDKEIDQNL